MKPEEKLDKIVEDISEIKVTLAKQAVQLEHHIKRTDLNEENMELLRAEFKPIQKHVDMFHGALKLIGGIAVVAGIARAIIEIVKFVG